MKRLLTLLLTITLFNACSDDNEKPKTSIQIDSNSVQYSVSTKKNTTIAIKGKRTYIDWGDNSIEEYTINKKFEKVTHEYKNSGTYCIKILTDSLTGLFLYDENNDTEYSELKIGNSVKLKEFDIENFNDLQYLDLNIADLENLLIMNCKNLKSISVNKCLSLNYINIKHTPITTLDLRNNNKISFIFCEYTELNKLLTGNIDNLSSFGCNYSKIKTLSLENAKNLSFIECIGNNLTNVELKNNPMLVELLLDNNMLDTNAINQIFSDLLPVGYQNKKYITFKNNPGEETCDKKIVLDKGWSIENYSQKIIQQ